MRSTEVRKKVLTIPLDHRVRKGDGQHASSYHERSVPSSAIATFTWDEVVRSELVQPLIRAAPAREGRGGSRYLTTSVHLEALFYQSSRSCKQGWCILSHSEVSHSYIIFRSRIQNLDVQLGALTTGALPPIQSITASSAGCAQHVFLLVAR